MRAIVVLGAAVWANGPSPTLQRRCAHAAQVWHENRHELVVVCGGKGLHDQTEAAAMTDILMTHGVPRDQIIQEDRSTTTLENLTFAKPLLMDRGIRHITIVTDGYHGPRARLVARMIGLRSTVSSPGLRGSHLPTQARKYVREAVALPAYAARLTAQRIRQFRD